MKAEGKVVVPVETAVWYKFAGSAIEITSTGRTYTSLSITPNDTMGNPIVCSINNSNITSSSEYSFSQSSGTPNIDLSFSTTSVGYPSQTYISVKIVPDSTAMSYFYNDMPNNTTATITGNITCKGYSLPYTISVTKTSTDYTAVINVMISNNLSSYVEITSLKVGFSSNGTSFSHSVGSETNVTSNKTYNSNISTKYSYGYCEVKFKYLKYYSKEITLLVNSDYPTSGQNSKTDKFNIGETIGNTKTITLFREYTSGTQSNTDFAIDIS